MSVSPRVAALDNHVSQLVPKARLTAQALQQAPEITLYLINADFPRCQLDAETTRRLMETPPYWAFCWASGQVLARYLLDNPQLVAGRHVVDFGAGSGVVGIAAALAGAARVTCCDNDPMACQAIAANAALNQVTLEIVEQLPGEAADLMVLADVLYDRENLPLVASLVGRARELLLADSRVRNLQLPPFVLLDSYDSCTWPDLDESEEFNTVRLYRARSELAVEVAG